MGTTTTTFALNKPTVGGDDNAWGTDLNANADKLDDLLDGTTAIRPNLSQGLWKVGGVAITATAAELNKLDGLLPTTTELNFVDGVTSAIQTQLNAKSPIDNPTFTGDVTAPDIRLTSTGDVSLVSTTHAFQIGGDAGLNLLADSNEIQARNNGAAAALNINNEGGNVVLGGGTASSTITMNGLASGAGLATQAEAETGTANDKLMTPLRLRNALNATGSAPTYACRAWVNFNGTGTVAIRGSGNVSSITDNGTGDYTVNFTTAMPDANYAAVGMPQSAYGLGILSLAAGSVRVRTPNFNNTAVDTDPVCVSVFR